MKEEELIKGNIYHIAYREYESYLFKCVSDGSANGISSFITIDIPTLKPSSYHKSAGNLSQSNSSFRGKDYILASSDIANFYNKCTEANKIVEYQFNKQQESFIDLIF